MTTLNFQNGDMFVATISDQIVSSNPRDELQLILTVTVTAQLVDSQNPDAGTRELSPFERNVYLTFYDDSTKRRIAQNTLRHLGFEDPRGFSDEAILRLHPDHEDAVQLVGQEVYVRCAVKGEETYWNIAWFAAKPTPLSLKEATSLAERRAARSAASNGAAEFGPGPASAASDAPPSVTY